MDDDALPQRQNARRKLREQQPEENESERDFTAPTSSGHTAGVVVASAEAAVLQGRMADVPAEPSTATPLRERQLAGPGTGGSDQGRPPGSQIDDGGTLPAYRSAAVGSFKFEYLDHTADVQLHAWGRNLAEAFEQCALAMFNYISPLEHVRLRDTRSYRAEGHDLQSLLFAFLDELLFVFSTEMFVAGQVTITAFNKSSFVIVAEGVGETFDRSFHEVGTEIKAITYSAMSISERDDDAEVFVIVDI